MSTLILLCGMSGAGKTTYAHELRVSRKALRLCPDEWIRAVIKNTADKEERDRLRDPMEAVQWMIAQDMLKLGQTVILENGFWSRKERQQYANNAKAGGSTVELHYLKVSPQEAWRRIESRNATLSDGLFRITHEELASWWQLFEAPIPDECTSYDCFFEVEGPNQHLRATDQGKG